MSDLFYYYYFFPLPAASLFCSVNESSLSLFILKMVIVKNDT